GNTPYQVLSYLYINNDISFGPTVLDEDGNPAVAQTNVTTTGLGELGIITNIPTITIDNQMTFPPTGMSGYWNQPGTTNAANAMTLLHELGHVLEALGWQGDQILN